MNIFLVRHGESEANRAHLQSLEPGNSASPSPPARDPALTELGVKQAAAAGAALRAHGVSRVYTSPLIRALETAHEISRTAECGVEVWGELCERFFNSPAPYAHAEIAGRFPRFELGALPCDAQGDWWTALRDGTPEDMFERARRATERVRNAAAHSGGGIAVVIHGGMGATMIDLLLGVQPTEHVRYALDNCAISILSLEDGRGTLRELNSAEHLNAEMRAPALRSRGYKAASMVQ